MGCLKCNFFVLAVCRCNGPRHGVGAGVGVSVSPPQARSFFDNITAFLTLLHGSLCRNFDFSQRALLLAQRASSVDKLGDSAAGSLFDARRALLPFIARHRLLWHCYPYRGHAFARPASVTDQPRVDPHRGRSYCHPSAQRVHRELP